MPRSQPKQAWLSCGPHHVTSASAWVSTKSISPMMSHVSFVRDRDHGKRHKHTLGSISSRLFGGHVSAVSAVSAFNFHGRLQDPRPGHDGQMTAARRAWLMQLQGSCDTKDSAGCGFPTLGRTCCQSLSCLGAEHMRWVMRAHTHIRKGRLRGH